MTFAVHGIAVARGIAIGRAVVMGAGRAAVAPKVIEPAPGAQSACASAATR